MEQLSGLDASFLALETEHAPMHIAGVSILDPRRADGERLDSERLRAFIGSRLQANERLRQRLAEVPLELGRPYWVADPEFDLDRHFERTQLPAPGGWRELSALMAWELTNPLPRDRPLWQMTLVEGLDTIPGVPAGAVALIGKVHHAAIDGLSGVEIMTALLDPAPTPWSPAPAMDEEAPRADAELPSRFALLKRSGRNLLRPATELGAVVGKAIGGLARSGAAWGIERVTPPPMPFSAPRSVLNQPIGKDHVWGGATLSLDRIRAIKDRTEATVNDVVLAVCAGALRRDLEARDSLPARPLVAMVPISVRDESQRGSMGNQVSAMLVQLATDEADPLARLTRIRQGAGRAKTHHQAVGARTLTDSAQIVPFSLAGRAARLYSRMELAEKHRPIFNLVITNVPGPQLPLYIDGAPLLHHFGAAPIFDGMGLLLAIFSYNGELTVGVCSSREVMPDVHAFTRAIEESLDELEAAVSA
nr:putative wax ester synthase/acyl-CoA:diacylglycerol acyltransferase [uncultured bacterium]